MPVLAGERLVARVDLESDRAKSTLRVNRTWIEPGTHDARARKATAAACERLAGQLGLALEIVTPHAASARRRSSAPR